MDLGGLFGGNWGDGMAQGWQMAAQMDQMNLRREQAKQQQQLMRMKMEEMGLKMQEQRKLREEKDKIRSMIMPTTETTQVLPDENTSWQSGEDEYGDIPTTTQTVTKPSLLIEAIRKKHGPEYAKIAETIAPMDPLKVLEMALRPREKQGLTEVELLSRDPNDPARKNYIAGKYDPRWDMEDRKEEFRMGLEDRKDARREQAELEKEIQNTTGELERVTKGRRNKKDRYTTEYEKAKEKIFKEIPGNDYDSTDQRNKRIGELNADWNSKMQYLYDEDDENIKFLQGKLKDLQQRRKGGLSSSGGGGGGGKVIVRYGTDRSGKRWAQYSDGSIAPVGR